MTREMRRLENGGRGQGISRRQFLRSSVAVIGAAGSRHLLPSATLSSIHLGNFFQAEPVINVMDSAFGAKGDGETNDRDAFQAAIDTAIAQKIPLLIPRPPQFYRIVLEPNHKNLAVKGDLVILGEGRNSTPIRFTIQDPQSGQAYSGFQIVGGSRFRVSDLRLEEDLHHSAEEFEFMGLYFESGGKDHTCVVENVDIDGFTHCLYTPASSTDGGTGELTLEVRNCDLHPWWQYAVAFWTIAEGHKRLHIYDSYLHDNQFSHLIYCHPHNSVHIENTRFDGATGWAFQFQGSAVAGDPEYQRFVGCWFGSRNSRGIITQDRETVTVQVEILNCIFECRPAIQIRSELLIDGCYFTSPVDNPVSTAFIAAYSNSPWAAVIRNCIFAPRSNTLPQVDCRLDNIDITIENCQFFNQGSGIILALGTGATNRYRLSNCLFYNRVDNASQAVSIQIDNGQAVIDACRFWGRTMNDRGVINCATTETGPSDESFIQMDNCVFQEISGGSLFYVSGSAPERWSNKIRGQYNPIINYYSGKPLLVVESGRPVYGQLAPVPGQAPSPLSAGSTLVINSNYDTYQVIGTVDVANLHWWSEDGLSDPLFSGEITLIAGMPFSLVTGGNIQLAERGGGMSIPAGEAIRLLYTSDQGMWTIVS